MEFTNPTSPYIPFSSPTENLRVTPLLNTDGPTVIELMNDPRVCMFLVSPPHPYTNESWDEWFPDVAKSSESYLREYHEIMEGKRKWCSGCPFIVIRDTNVGSDNKLREGAEDGVGKKSDGGGKLIGVISIRRSDRVWLGENVSNPEQDKGEGKSKNASLEAGDPDILWEIGFYLSPSAHGAGITTVALWLMMKKFFIPYMNVHRVIGTFHEGNIPSRRVFEKNGFRFMGVTPDDEEIAESKTGVKGLRVGLGLCLWERQKESN